MDSPTSVDAGRLTLHQLRLIARYYVPRIIGTSIAVAGLAWSNFGDFIR